MKSVFCIAVCLASTFSAADGFIAGTLVQTKEGFVPIESIQVGDLVMSCDLNGGACNEQKVSELFQTKANSYLEIDLGDSTIGVSEKHHFFSTAESKWMAAQDFGRSMQMMKFNFEDVEWKEMRSIAKEVTLFNLTVEATHNYVVSVKQILVHNKNGEPLWLSAVRYPTRHGFSTTFLGAVGFFSSVALAGFDRFPRVVAIGYRGVMLSVPTIVVGIFGIINVVRRELMRAENALDPYRF